MAKKPPKKSSNNSSNHSSKNNPPTQKNNRNPVTKKRKKENHVFPKTFVEYKAINDLPKRYEDSLTVGAQSIQTRTDRLRDAHLFLSYMLSEWIHLEKFLGKQQGKTVHGILSELGQAMMGIRGALLQGSYVGSIPLVRMVMERSLVCEIIFARDETLSHTEQQKQIVDRIKIYEGYSIVQERNYYVFSQKEIPDKLQKDYDKIITAYQRDQRSGKTTRYHPIHAKTGVRMLLQLYGYDKAFGGDLYSMTSTVMHGSTLVSNFLHEKNGLLPLYDIKRIEGLVKLALQLFERGVSAVSLLIPDSQRDKFLTILHALTKE